MLITPRPGTDAKSILQSLSDIQMKASNLRSGVGPLNTAHDWLVKYLEWATEAVEQLRYSVSDADIDRLVLTRRYYVLMDGAARFSGNEQARLVNGLVSLELAERADTLGAAVKALKDRLERWTRHDWFVVADSSFYIHNATRIELTDLHEVLGLPSGDAIHLLFPMTVVDELDNLKNTGKQQARWRSGHTLGLLDGLLAGGTTGIMRRRSLPAPMSDQAVLGAITVEIVADAPGHVRLPIPDDEIIDRAVAIQSLSGRKVRLLTCDTGQHTRGCLAGLKVTKIAHAAGTGEEPNWEAEEAKQGKGSGVRAQRKNRRDANNEATRPPET
jgi:hypothetical protein